MQSQTYTLSEHVSSGTTVTLTISTSTWIGTYFEPEETPPGARVTAFVIESITLTLNRGAGTTGSYSVVVTTADGSNEPTATVLGSQSLALTTLGTSPALEVITFATPVRIPPTGCCFYVKLDSGVNNITITLDSATSDTVNDYCSTPDAGANWTPNATRDVIFKVTGHFEYDEAGDDTSASTPVDGLSSVSMSMTLGAYDKRAMVALLLVRNGAGSPDPGDAVCTDMTFNGVAMTPIADSGPGPSSAYERVLAYALPAPASGTNNLVATLTGTHWLGMLVGVPFFGIDQTMPTPSDGASTGTGTSPTSPVSINPPFDIVLDAVAWSGAATASATAPPTGTRTQLASASNYAYGLTEGAAEDVVSPAWLLSGSSGYAHASVALQCYLPRPPPDYSNFPKPSLRPEASDSHDDPDNGPI